MKALYLIFISALISIFALQTQAHVSDHIHHETELFIDLFNKNLNEVIAEENTVRAQKGKKLYCSELSDYQKDLIAEFLIYGYSKSANMIFYKDIAKVSVSEFTSFLGEALECYPKTWPHAEGLIVDIANAKSYWMNSGIAVKALEKMAGHEITNYQLSLEKAVYEKNND